VFYIGCGYLERGGLATVRRQAGAYEVVRSYGVTEGLPGPKVRALYYDSEGRLWAATENDGVMVIPGPDPDDINLSGVYITKDNGLPDNEIKQIVEYGGYFYLAARRGIARFPTGALDVFIGS